MLPVQKMQTYTGGNECWFKPTHLTCNHLVQLSHCINIVSSFASLLQTHRVESFERVLREVEGVGTKADESSLMGERVELEKVFPL